MNEPVWNDVRMCWTMGETATHYVEIAPQLMGLAFICLTPKEFDLVYDERWDYPDIIRAAVAAFEWAKRGYVGEPHLWERHLPTGRRRKDGDPSTETHD